MSLTAPLLALISFSLFLAPTAAQQDPVANFCRRFGHQTAVVDDKLFIDGGLINWNPLASFPSNYTNTWLLYQDLSTTASTGMPPLYANLSKNGSIPNVAGGALWSDSVNKRLYLFGGEHNLGEPPLPFNLYGYDILNNQWDSFGPSRTGASISKVSYGAGVSVDSRGEAYYFGGWLSNASVPNWGTGPPVATTGLVKYTMDTNSFSNNTGPDNIRRAEGSLQYIPAGEGGMLIYFGGIQDLSANGTATGQPIDQIFIYDVLSSKWYTQKATGQIPEMRRRFCAGVTWAADQSSYNIYMYGGATVPGVLGGGYDDLYVLSIPTFTWVKMYPLGRNGTGDYPHHSLTCNIIPGRGQMIISGGNFPLTQDCDSPGQWGTHNADLGKQNPNKSLWDLYKPNKTTYAVPDEVLAVVGGNGNGGATKTTPANGFDYTDVALLITLKADVAVRTPTRAVNGFSPPAPSTSLSTGAIVGIAVGAAVLVIALAVGCFLVRKRRQRVLQNRTSPPGPSHLYHAQSMSEPWSGPPSHLSPMPSPYSPPYGHSASFPLPPTSPHPMSPQTVSPHMSPPVELPSQSSQTTPAGMMGDTSILTHMSSASSYPPQHAYFGETTTLLNQPRYDAHGNMWVPQVSMVQVAPGVTPPLPEYTPARGDQKTTPQPVAAEVQPAPAQEPQELSADPDDRAEASTQHQTYYNR
ncbi:Kelch repeat-containing protein [Colletotrichum spaethianum]|uniref:Kelch repeat-containing protein n=1 Tax=Colletotrichum spaethianum TaxID=700344 RepID=A0AA37P999_9PEZI|nr:Kelch repeat-containing protein [Colletotrichum spaethianum]GKT48028.1 Kelch repeat-containing protein [Colletotrichum spaethianum]